ncbi:LysR family transcriptional regulator [Pseudoroseicyclus tamaricis]|uniref:LysR family transcriptional regulator n=1 Tax=Pseudoroseicyclus tamaricis TaxID=2705421 RepID=A0A6B2JWU2_9RHOB|nr:LysR family transcriptional regulator [Pseudoroseicyclus tamaricis]NDV02600.1 LysR family transcriptional regulator [Pseudoroseicyclus tamaricis]
MDIADLDWSLMRAFLAVAEEGSLSAAARRLGQSQPTLGRQVKALERALGAELFSRVPKGLEPTSTAAALLPHAQAMRAAMGQVALAAAAGDARPSGTVRLTASDAVCTWRLPPVIAALREAEPGIEIELVPSDSSSNLLYREADIALRMYRPRQMDLIARHIADVPLALFAAQSYVDRKGLPTTLEELRGHDLVGFDRNTALLEGFRALGLPAEEGWFPVRCDDNIVNWALTRAGCGIGVGQRAIGRADPALVEMPLPLDLPPLPVWLTSHEAMRRTPRIARTWDLLVELLRPVFRDG